MTLFRTVWIVALGVACGSPGAPRGVGEADDHARIEALETRIEQVGMRLATDDPMVVEPWLDAKESIELAQRVEDGALRDALVREAEQLLAEAVSGARQPSRVPARSVPVPEESLVNSIERPR